jgi:hypothetical protein
MSKAKVERKAVPEVSGGADKTTTGARNASRRDAIRKKRQRDERRAYIIAGVAALVVLAVITAGIIMSNGGVGRPGPIEGEVQKAMEVPSQGHVDPPTRVTYRDNPPASGQHYPNTADYGFHSEEVQPENWVHNLEHGGIVILYNCPEDCPDMKDSLQQLYNEAPQSKAFHTVKMVITSYPNLQSKVMAVAWGWQLSLDNFDKDKLLQFYQRHVDQGPEQAL